MIRRQHKEDLVWEEFGDKKVKGRIAFVVDITANKIYPVPKNIEHKNFIIFVKQEHFRILQVE
ncbi:hypothetical protein J4449_04455 [Candidatus Woesearchaeota archaeon]|nr:hypothetical protein [Candidatus Woesearchaeota archaeon]